MQYTSTPNILLDMVHQNHACPQLLWNMGAGNTNLMAKEYAAIATVTLAYVLLIRQF